MVRGKRCCPGRRLQSVVDLDRPEMWRGMSVKGTKGRKFGQLQNGMGAKGSRGVIRNPRGEMQRAMSQLVVGYLISERGVEVGQTEAEFAEPRVKLMSSVSTNTVLPAVYIE